MVDRKALPIRPFDFQEFTDRGKADLKIKRNDPRFGDNPLSDHTEEELDEFASGSQIERLHQMLTRIGVSDQQIKGGIDLTQRGKNRVAGRLGISPNDVKMYLDGITQKLRKADAASEETLTEQYYKTIDEDEAGQSARPFDEPRYSMEPDALGSITVRDAQTGRSSFIQGAEASRVRQALKSAPDKQAVLAPLVEADDFLHEIKASSGTYNFIWNLGGKHGTGTAQFSTKGTPKLKLVDVRDAEGEAMAPDPAMHRALMQQARAFIDKV
jgi:hypothetical protein